jgi:uncharacterized hydantoinase/oxoprolinase family protein
VDASYILTDITGQWAVFQGYNAFTADVCLCLSEREEEEYSGEGAERADKMRSS